jgi:hypothetical protein
LRSLSGRILFGTVGGRAPAPRLLGSGSFPVVPWGRTPCQNHFALDDWEERGRPACGFGRRARNLVGQISWLKGFRRDAENGNRDGCAPFLDGFCLGRWVAMRQHPAPVGLRCPDGAWFLAQRMGEDAAGR